MFDIPLSENPVVFGYRTAQDSEENIQVLTGEFAAFQASAAGDASGIRVIPKDEWELYGYEVREFEGQRVLHNVFDYTEAKLKQRKKREQTIAEANPDTVGQLKEQIARQQEQMNRLMNLVERLSGESPDELKQQEVESAAKQRETEELKALADVAPTEEDHIQRKKPGPKPKDKAA
jgi:uncharacterized coiled-coil protein SlyX